MTVPNPLAQHRTPILTITPGISTTYRLAFVGGDIFDIVGGYDDESDAYAAWQAAMDASRALAAMFNRVKP